MAKPDSPQERRQAYWRENLTLVAVLLTVWFVVSFLLSIVFADDLNQFKLGSFPLGFWIAEQGSLYVFVALIFIYVWLMNRLDRKYGLEEDDDDGEAGE